MSSNLPDPHRDALLTLSDRLDGVEWAVTASANLALQGLPVDPDDVDVLTDEAGAYAIEERFADAVVRPVAPPVEAAADRIRSHFGALSIAGVEVEVMGDVEHRVDGEWGPSFDAAAREFVALDGRRIPVMPLAHEARGYEERGRHETAEFVRDRL